MTHLLRPLGVLTLALLLAACTKVAIGPDGAPYDSRGPSPPYAEGPSPGMETEPAEGDPSGAREIPPPISLGAPYEAESEPERYSSPVVARLSHEAQSQKGSGRLDQALSTTERALRIDPTNPELWLLLGQIQLERGNDVQAEQLARKSISLAGGDISLKARCWRLIGDARRSRGDAAGAGDALEKARQLEGDLSRKN